MADIKTKNKVLNTIKKLDRTVIYTSKVKDNIVDIKDKENYSQAQEGTPSEYGANKITKDSGFIFHKGTNEINKYGKKFPKAVQNNIKNTQRANKQMQKIKTARNRAKNIRNIREANKSIKGTVIQTEKTIKSTKNINTKAIKTTKNIADTTIKSVKGTTKATKKAIDGAKKSYQIAKQTAKKTSKAIKRTIRATITTVKAIIAGTKALIAFLIAGGWIVAIIIIVICLIAMLCSSIFGIFFASEDTGSKITVGETQKVATMNQVVSDINKEFINKITKIQNENSHDEYDISSNRAEWKDVLAIYSIKVNGGNNQNEVLTIDDSKVKQLKDIFWEMNEISYTTEEKKETKTEIHLTSTETKTITTKILHITITSKSAEEMAKKYNFNKEQMKQLEELTDEKYASMWSAVIYGISIGSSDIVAVAESQIGNVGGQPYWSWYGFKARVEWCACFVSWCANECGYIEAGIIPKFAGCQNEGVDWFKACNLWKDRGFVPKGRRYYIL